MNIIKAQNLACPIDGERLEITDKQYTCINGHTYDVARQGYVNLLPVQHKRSKQPGDSKAMVLARTRFLDTGFYDPIAGKLNGIITDQLSDGAMCILDAGCGEGYYLNALYQHIAMQAADTTLSFIGLDISKDAIIQSTKRNKQISWIVGTNRQPPVLEQSVDIILCLFGFINFDGFDSVLKPGGKIVLVDPGAEHLKELREIIYPELKSQELSQADQAEDTRFTQVGSETLQFKTTITDKALINDLLIMTPHFYRASKQGRQAASELTELEITADIIFRTLEKLPSVPQ